MSSFDVIMGLALLILAAAFYLLPWLVAWHRHHRNTGAILTMNLLLGWTFLFWALALIWAFTDNTAGNRLRIS